MSKCLKCGAELPPVGECPVCAAAAAADTLPGGPPVPSLLDKDIHIDRRRTPERTPAVTESAVPSFADLALGQPAPPGLAPAHPAAAPAQPPGMTPAPRTQTPALGSPVQAVPQPPGMTPAQRPPLPPSVPTPQAQAEPSPQQLPVPSPASIPPPQRIPVPGPQAAQHVPPPGAPVPPPGVPVPPPGALVPPPPSSAAADDDPDTTAPGQPSFANQPPPSDVPSAMATPTQRAELPVASAPPQPPPPAPVPAPGARPPPAPVSVVTFSPPARLPVPPPHAVLPTDEQLTPRLPMPRPPPLGAQASAQQREQPSSPGVQEIHARPASLWRRLLSFTIDTAAIVGVATLYITLASSIAGVKEVSSQGLTTLDSLAAWMHALKSVLLPGAVLLVVLATAYCAVAAFLWNGRTLGRLLLGLRLVDTHGVAPAPTRAIVRAILSVVSFGLFLGGFWMALFDKRGQTLHDKLTSTFVIQPS